MSQSETFWRPATDPATRNYPFNCWWVAAISDEVSRDMLGRWLLDTPVLPYSREDGTAVALENRCPHRGAPLTLGCRSPLPPVFLCRLACLPEHPMIATIMGRSSPPRCKGQRSIFAILTVVM